VGTPNAQIFIGLAYRAQSHNVKAAEVILVAGGDLFGCFPQRRRIAVPPHGAWDWLVQMAWGIIQNTQCTGTGTNTIEAAGCGGCCLPGLQWPF